ncbi:MAG: DUF4276 family protein [Polyangiaceae bacterium]|nr:DUF4276 family protein [Polyangiaceae bacterium]
MIYLRAGVYAEGPSDYDFLCRLLDRHIDALAAPLFSGDYVVADTIGIDAPSSAGARHRDERIAAAVAEHGEICVLFVIHADSDGDSERARETRIQPGISAARAALPDREIVAVPCVPVREIEAWLLTDRDAFRELLGSTFDGALPADPEKEMDPKAALRRILKDGGARQGPESIYALFGELVQIASLRALPAFLAFEAEMVEAIKQVARCQGWRG